MNVNRAWRSTIGKKLIMGLSGLLLIGFLIVHLLGNLALFLPDGGRFFNLYTHKLESTKPWLYIAELGLVAVFLFHIVSGIRVFLTNRRARMNRYATYASKGGPTKLSTASRTMILTGLVLMVFVPLHVALFKYGTYYETVIDGVVMRDLYRLVIEKFKVPFISFTYAGVMFLLGMHLRHGFWSAFQSLGAMNPRWTPAIYTLGVVIAILLAGGFFILPLYVYFFV